jgi:hypothetical protein
LDLMVGSSANSDRRRDFVECSRNWSTRNLLLLRALVNLCAFA